MTFVNVNCCGSAVPSGPEAATGRWTRWRQARPSHPRWPSTCSARCGPRSTASRSRWAGPGRGRCSRCCCSVPRWTCGGDRPAGTARPGHRARRGQPGEARWPRRARDFPRVEPGHSAGLQLRRQTESSAGAARHSGARRLRIVALSRLQPPAPARPWPSTCGIWPSPDPVRGPARGLVDARPWRVLAGLRRVLRRAVRRLAPLRRPLPQHRGPRPTTGWPRPPCPTREDRRSLTAEPRPGGLCRRDWSIAHVARPSRPGHYAADRRPGSASDVHCRTTSGPGRLTIPAPGAPRPTAPRSLFSGRRTAQHVRERVPRTHICRRTQIAKTR